jgi:hypothetical protein
MKYSKVFVLGDSRTGTTSLAQYLANIGYRSIHLYESEANMLPHSDENYKLNEERIISFVETSGFNAFSDYPTRLYYPVLSKEFPESAFILSSRMNTQVWIESMKKYMQVLRVDFDVEKSIKSYENINELIRQHFKGHGNFLDLCISETENASDILNKFFQLSNNAQLPVANTFFQLLKEKYCVQ